MAMIPNYEQLVFSPPPCEILKIVSEKENEICESDDGLEARFEGDKCAWLSDRNKLTLPPELCSKLGCSAEEMSFVTGGVQQYLNRLQKFTKTMDNSSCFQVDAQPNCAQPRRLNSPTNFSSLPVYVKLHIFSFLDAQDLCRLSLVNREWLSLTSDSVLWNNLLEQDMVTWSVIGHMTNPAVYREVDSDWSDKEIYLQCCPKMRKLMRQENFAFVNISTMLRAFLPKKVPKIAMFGPGLESSTSGIVRKILYEKNNLFDIKQLFPGQFEGVGSGMTLQMRSGLKFDLTVLYSATRMERENRGINRMQRSRLVQRNLHQMEEGQSEAAGYELTQAVRDLCRTLDAFIYVVDATVESFPENVNNTELCAMVNERWSATHVPVLVLSCVRNASIQRTPCVKVVDQLQLSRLDKPWQAHDVDVDTLDGVVDGVHWLIEQSHRR